VIDRGRVALPGVDAACCGVLLEQRLYLRLRRGSPLAGAALALAIFAGACNRPETPPTPVVPQPMQPQAAMPEATSVPVPPPPPKVAPSAVPQDAPEFPTTAPSVSPEKPGPNGALEVPPATLPAETAKKSKAPKGVREIHPTPGNTGCLEMYGTCTPPPDQICTSSAFYLDCNAKGQLPSNGEWLRCICP
jgi:hypothetical protein